MIAPLPKANYVEACIKSLKKRLYKFMYARQTNRFIDDLDDIVAAHNNSFHCGIMHIPASVDLHK